jgi:hypothetical protein
MPQARDAKQRCSRGPLRGLSPSRFVSNPGIVQLPRSGVEHMPFYVLALSVVSHMPISIPDHVHRNASYHPAPSESVTPLSLPVLLAASILDVPWR